MVDYHIHTTYSCDSQLEPEMVCNRAIELGLNEIAFTEHLDLDPKDEGYGLYDYEGISKKLSELQSIYDGRLKIKKGVEVTYQRKRENEIRQFIEDKDYDFILGSVHLVGDFDISGDEGTKRFFECFNRKEAFLSYFKVTNSLVQSGLFDCLGHFEMIRRYGISCIRDYTYEEFKEPIDKILNMLIEKEMALEINTSGLRHLPKETYPRMEIVERFLDLGGVRLTIGSDSHLPEHIGYRIPETMELLISMDIEKITLFRKRVATGFSLQ